VSGAKRHQPRTERRVPPTPAHIDLHSHTTRSDGILTPSELVQAASAAGLRILAITDHDTLAGVRDLRRTASIPAGLEVLPGIELNSVLTEPAGLGEGEVHVLGIGVDPDDDELEAALSRQRRSRRLRYERMVRRLRDLGMPIDAALEQQPATNDDDALGRPRIARAMIAAGYATSVEDAFQRHLSKGRPAYVPRLGLNAIESIKAIRSAGGLASLAHFAEAPEHLPFLRELIDAGLTGLEVYYRAYELPVVESLRKIALDLRLVMTGGTDFHGDRESYAEAHAQLWVPDEIEPPLREALRHSTPRVDSADVTDLRVAYDTQLRGRIPEPLPAGVEAERDGPVVRFVYPRSGFIGYRDLGGLDGAELDAFIARQVRAFSERGKRFEWKLHGHDQPADISDRLLGAGFVPEELETVVIARVGEVAAPPRLPAGITLREVTSRDDFDRIAAMEAEIWGDDHLDLADMFASERAADPEAISIFVAEAGDRVVSAAWIRFERGTEFATLWGGGTLPEWRRRGIYRATVAHRANVAAERGFRLLQVDSSADSRPILERLGFVAVTTTTPYIWTPDSMAGS
jgi:predicted metal-dependent phosphoesterase TrpH/GNAT superfamily N-acetyltransferase